MLSTSRRSTRAGRTNRSKPESRATNVSRSNEPARKWIQVRRRPAKNIGFTITMWVPVEKLTAEEKSIYLSSDEEEAEECEEEVMATDQTQGRVESATTSETKNEDTQLEWPKEQAQSSSETTSIKVPTMHSQAEFHEREDTTVIDPISQDGEESEERPTKRHKAESSFGGEANQGESNPTDTTTHFS